MEWTYYIDTTSCSTAEDEELTGVQSLALSTRKRLTWCGMLSRNETVGPDGSPIRARVFDQVYWVSGFREPLAEFGYQFAARWGQIGDSPYIQPESIGRWYGYIL